MRFLSMLIMAWVGSSWLAMAKAEEQPSTCAQAYESAQEEKATGRLRAAIEHLKTCIDPGCAQFIREDCVRWMDQAESALPTVVFSVREDGEDLTDVEIQCDHKPLTGTLDGKALPVDPGLHDFSFTVRGLAPTSRQVLIREGERNRIVNVEFSKPSVAPPSPSAGATTMLPGETDLRPKTGALPYAFAGVGALGVVGFTAFALLGNSQQGELERTCSPFCQSSQVDSVKTKYLLADLSLGVGLVSLAVATYIFVKNHDANATSAAPETSVTFIPRSSGAGGVLQLSTSY
jgi:hypothetical protein